MALTDIVSVNISISDATPKAIEFNTPLIVAKAPYLGSRLYNASPVGLAAMVTDGFNTYDRAYKLLSALAAQTGGAGKAYVRARTTQQSHTIRFIPDITKTAVGFVIEFDISYQGVTSTISYTVATNTVDAIIDGVEALIDASAAGLAGITTTPSGGVATHLDLIADVAGDFIELDGFGPEVILKDQSADGSLAAQLAAAEVELGEAYYGLLIDGFSETEGNLARAHAEANRKICLLLCADDEIATDTSSPTDLATDALAANRTGVAFTRHMSSSQHAALMGLMFGKTPGSATWRHKRLAGVSADVLTATEEGVLLGKRALSYTSKRGIALTDSGRAGSGRPFDITHGVDKLQADIETSVLLVFANNDKVPYNQTGLAQIKAAIEGPLAAAEAAGLVEPGWFVEMPSLADISDADKGNRTLPDVHFSGVFTGAIESVTIAGTLSLS